MEMLVLMMLALFLIIIAIAVIIYVIVRKNGVEKKFNNMDDSDFDDDDDDDNINMNIVMPSNFQSINDENKDNNLNIIEKNEIKDENYDIDDVKVNDEHNHSLNEITNINVQAVEEKSEEVKLDWVVNVLINKRNYIFLANGNDLSKNSRIKLILDSKVYYGVVTKANYQRDISLLKIKPRKLNVVKVLDKVDNKKDDADELELIPIKKKNK